MVGAKLFVEGGGDGRALRIECRQGFSEFLKKAGLAGRMPRIVPCGGRQSAYDDFCTAINNKEAAFLLVDSEAPVASRHQPGEPDTWQPWSHLFDRDGWSMPPQTDDLHCHLMVQCTESWFLADPETLENFFGQGFEKNQLPPIVNGVEVFPKERAYQALINATRHSRKGKYGKAEHSFKLLALIAPVAVVEKSPWAERLIDTLKRELQEPQR